MREDFRLNALRTKILNTMKFCARDSLLHNIQDSKTMPILFKYFIRSMFFAILCELKAQNCDSAMGIIILS
jgi:hypothetical protein